MTITVTPDPLASPPVNNLELSVPGSSIMQSLLVWRNDPGAIRTELRSQPIAGFNSRPAEDPECPYEVPVTYGWTVTYTDPSALSTVWNETWASLAAWTTTSGSWNVSGGQARNTTTGSTSVAYREFAEAKVRVTVASLFATASGERARIYVEQSSSHWVTVSYRFLDDTVYVQYKDAGGAHPEQATSLDPTQPIIIDLLDDAVLVSGTGDSVSLPFDLTASKVQIVAVTPVSTNNVRIGAILVEAYGSATTVTEISDPVTLDVHDTWLVHPAAPGKSFKLQNLDALEAGIRTFGDLSRPSRANIVDVMGSDLPVPITFGPRGGAQLSIAIATVTSAERLALDAVLADEVPLLVQVPPSWGADFDVGFYSFLTSLERRFVAWLSRQQSARMFEIPIVKVGSPIVDVANSGWSVAAVLAEFASVAEVLATFDTTADLLVNNRS